MRAVALSPRDNEECRCPWCPINKLSKPAKEWVYQLDDVDRLVVVFTPLMKIDDEVRLSTSFSQAVSTSLDLSI